MRAVLGETFRLLGTHLHLFTLIALTVWLPGHVLLKYLEFFEPDTTSPGRWLRVALFIQVFFDPLVVAGTVAALGRIKQSLPVGYGVALVEGLAAWPRLFVVRFIINCAVLLPALGAMALGRPHRGMLWQGAGLLLLTLLVFIALLRIAVIDSVVVLERRHALNAWVRAAELTRGRRAQILGVALVLFLFVLGLALLAGQLFEAVPALNHFVVRVLVDSAVGVAQSLFTVAFFLFYWRARSAAPGPGPAPAA